MRKIFFKLKEKLPTIPSKLLLKELSNLKNNEKYDTNTCHPLISTPPYIHSLDTHLIQQLITLGGALYLFPGVLQFGCEGLEVFLESPSQLLVASGFLKVPGLSEHAGLVQ